MSLVESVGVQDLFVEYRVNNSILEKSVESLQRMFRDSEFKGGREGGEGEADEGD